MLRHNPLLEQMRQVAFFVLWHRLNDYIQKPLSLDEEREKARLREMSVLTYVTPEQTGFDNAIRQTVRF